MNDIRQGTCPLCGHNEIIESEPKVHVDGREQRVFLVNVPNGPGIFAGSADRGVMRSFTCRQCEHTQLFAQGAATVPIGREHGTRLVTGPAGGGPFR